MRWTTFAVCALLATQAHAIGLGQIEVNSHLNERFDGRIPITGAAPHSDLVVALASPDQFRKAGMERPFVLALLHFDVVEGETGPQYVRVTSQQPIREPALQFLLAAESPDGTLLQDYTVLLDPASGVGRAPIASPPAPPAPPAADAAAPIEAPTTPAPAAAAPEAAEATAAPAAEAPPADAGAASAGTYGPVTDTDTLWSLGDRLRPDESVSVYQMMVALKRANPDAFAGDRYDGLRKGASLRIPDTADVRAVGADDARAEVRGALGQ